MANTTDGDVTIDKKLDNAHPGRPTHGTKFTFDGSGTDSPEYDISETGIFGIYVPAAFAAGATLATIHVGYAGNTVATASTIDLTAAGYVEFDSFAAVKTIKLVLDNAAGTGSFVLLGT